MKYSKVLARTGILLFSALCLLVFQLANSILLGNTVALAQDEFPTVPPSDAEFESPIEDLDPIPTPIPTIGPGATFDEDDPNLPEIDEDGRVGDDEYGYYQLPEDPSLYLIWTTNEDGTHYTVVAADSHIGYPGGYEQCSRNIDPQRTREQGCSRILEANQQEY